MYKITSSEDDLRKFLRKKFWSLGTSLGYLGPVSQADPDERFFQPHFLVVWTPYDYPELAVSETQTKNLKIIRARCDMDFKHEIRHGLWEGVPCSFRITPDNAYPIYKST